MLKVLVFFALVVGASCYYINLHFCPCNYGSYNWTAINELVANYNISEANIAFTEASVPATYIQWVDCETGLAVIRSNTFLVNAYLRVCIRADINTKSVRLYQDLLALNGRNSISTAATPTLHPLLYGWPLVLIALW